MGWHDRREFLKLSCLTGLGAVALSATDAGTTPSGTGQLTLDVWRVRPGGPIPVVLRAPAAVDVHLVELDEHGQPAGRHWGPVPLRASAAGVYEGTFHAPDSKRPLYRVVAVARCGDVVISNPVEVVCAPFHVGS